MMGTISLRVPDKELDLYKDYAQIHNRSLSAVIRATMMERIEAKIADEAAARTAARHYAGEAAHEDLRDPAQGRSPE